MTDSTETKTVTSRSPSHFAYNIRNREGATIIGFALAAHGRTTTATASTSSLKPSRWTDESRSASLLKRTSNQKRAALLPAFTGMMPGKIDRI